MNKVLAPPLFSRFRNFVADNIGIYFSKDRNEDLNRAILRVTEEMDFASPEMCIDWLLNTHLTRTQIDILAGIFTVGETYFLRLNDHFQTLVELMIPQAIKTANGQRPIRIWSAGCATGEEPYSIAITLARAFPHLNKNDVSILATDINPYFIEAARKGIYSNWSFRDVPSNIIDQYFIRRGKNKFELISYIKEMVNFSYLNLVKDNYPSLINNTNAMDIIFCRNVMMYFQSKRQKMVIKKFRRTLVEGGYLVVAPVEVPVAMGCGLDHVEQPGSKIFRKGRITEEKTVSSVIFPQIVLPEYKMPEISPVIEPQGPEKEEKVQNKKEENLLESAIKLYEKDQVDKSLDKLSELLSSNNEEPGAYALYAKIMANQGHLKEALENCNEAIEKEKLEVAFYFLRGTILQEMGDIEDAIKDFDRAIYLNNDFILGHFMLGNLYRTMGNIKRSDKYFENVMTLVDNIDLETIVPQSEGITAGRLEEIIRSIQGREENGIRRKKESA